MVPLTNTFCDLQLNNTDRAIVIRATQIYASLDCRDAVWQHSTANVPVRIAGPDHCGAGWVVEFNTAEPRRCLRGVDACLDTGGKGCSPRSCVWYAGCTSELLGNCCVPYAVKVGGLTSAMSPIMLER
jgi:hypothetical protein